jgi:hypothetical protein
VQREVGRSSFLKKRSKKLSSIFPRRSGSVRHSSKVFWFFFSKKNTCFLFLCISFTPVAAQDFQAPGTPPPTLPPPEAVNPNDLSNDLTDPRVPIPDRNRIINELGVPDNPVNPYQQSTIKGDRPLFDDWFINISAIFDGVYEPKAVPVPVDVVETNQASNGGQFGRPSQELVSTTFLPTISIIKGDTAFKPPDFELRVTPAFNYSQLSTDELGIVNVNPAAGRIRNTRFVGVQEAFVDYHLQDVSSRYDFDAIRVGIQPFNADFRGFLFQDEQLGIRLFGDRGNNRFIYNVAYFRRIDKDTDSGLNDLSEPLRRDDIFLANLFVQDLPVLGYTTEFSVVENLNHEVATAYDKNGFQIIPEEFGLENPHKYAVTYYGLNGDGHIGRLNLTQSYYYAVGNDSMNELSGRPAQIRAYFGAIEPSMDFDWIRVRGSALYASGDAHPGNKSETGFDSILENPQFAGADTSYWIRQGIPFIGGGGINLVNPDGLLPDLRSSKDEGQSNPGLTFLGIGADFDVLPELRFSLNANHLSFNTTKILEILREQSPIHRNIGWDLSGAGTARPFDTQNIIFRLSAAFLVPGRGFQDLFAAQSKDQIYYSVLLNTILAY